MCKRSEKPIQRTKLSIFLVSITIFSACGSVPPKPAALLPKAPISIEAYKDFRQKQGPYRILFAGDTHFTWRVADLQQKNGLEFPVQPLQERFLKADYRLLNLETTMSSKGKPWLQKAYIFNSAPENIALLRFLGIQTAILGNNHSMDFGPEGLQATVAELKNAGIAAVGAGSSWGEAASPLVVRNDLLSFAILSFSMIGEHMTFSTPGRAGVASVRANSVRSQIQSLKKEVDLVIVSLHWGVEYYTRPQPEQIKLAHLMVDAGADAVIGHHPHIVQALEVYRGSIIAYSIGNFLFGSVNERQDNNMLLELQCDLESRQLNAVQIYPVFGRYRENKSDPVRSLNASETNDFWKKMVVMSQNLSAETVNRLRVNKKGFGRIELRSK
ncbi:MAG: CapA family protein [Leptospiraceae bacterium]|nr:CapA family protein [Leptospiraceae bacterium]